MDMQRSRQPGRWESHTGKGLRHYLPVIISADNDCLMHGDMSYRWLSESC